MFVETVQNANLYTYNIIYNLSYVGGWRNRAHKNLIVIVRCCIIFYGVSSEAHIKYPT